jgi:hypothetical protein
VKPLLNLVQSTQDTIASEEEEESEEEDEMQGKPACHQSKGGFVSVLFSAHLKNSELCRFEQVESCAICDGFLRPHS